MAMRTLGEALEAALASRLNDGEEGTAIPSVSPEKDAGTRHAPASRAQPAHGTAASLGNAKGRRTHPHELAPLGVRQPLVLRVIEGGWTGAGGSTPVQPIRRARQGGKAAGEFLKLVGGRDHAALR